MKRGVTILILLFLLVTPLILAEETQVKEEETQTTPKPSDIKSIIKDNPWNQTVTISPAWQTLIGGFFGLNLHNEDKAISVTEAIVFLGVFIMFFIIILDILKIISIFNFNLGFVSGEVFMALVFTTIVSITGAFISLKNLFISGIAYTVLSLDWGWLNFAITHKGYGILIAIFVVIPIIFIIHQILSWIAPLIKKYSKISRAEAKGRVFGDILSKEQTN